MEDKKVTFETIINECIEIYKKKILIMEIVLQRHMNNSEIFHMQLE